MDPADILLLFVLFHLVASIIHIRFIWHTFLRLWMVEMIFGIHMSLCILFSGKLYRFYSEGLEPLRKCNVFEKLYFCPLTLSVLRPSRF